MTNWVRNELIVTGKPEDVARFVEYVGEVMDFDKIIPHDRFMLAEYLDWQREHWGTKWNACACEEVIVTSFYDFHSSEPYQEAIYRFDTAWVTPKPVIRKIIKDWPELEIDGGYIIEGHESCGSFSAFQEYCQEGRAA
jgi:hypothetical protein